MKYREFTNEQKVIFWKALTIYLLILSVFLIPYIIFYLLYAMDYFELVLNNSEMTDFIIKDIGINSSLVFLSIYHVGGLLGPFLAISRVVTFLGKKTVLRIYKDKIKDMV